MILRNKDKIKTQIVAIYKKNTAVHLEYKQIGWASDMYIQYNSNKSYTFPLIICKKF